MQDPDWILLLEAETGPFWDQPAAQGPASAPATGSCYWVLSFTVTGQETTVWPQARHPAILGLPLSP
jgi:hypothetical protein